MAMRRTCNPEKPVRVWHGAPSGKSSVWFEHSIDNRAAAGSTPASRSMFSCGQVNRCHAGLISHASGVQLASPQPGFQVDRLRTTNFSALEVNIEVGNTQ